MDRRSGLPMSVSSAVVPAHVERRRFGRRLRLQSELVGLLNGVNGRAGLAGLRQRQISAERRHALQCQLSEMRACAPRPRRAADRRTCASDRPLRELQQLHVAMPELSDRERAVDSRHCPQADRTVQVRRSRRRSRGAARARLSSQRRCERRYARKGVRFGGTLKLRGSVLLMSGRASARSVRVGSDLLQRSQRCS